MELPGIGIGLAFLAGLASFLSPCVFSLVPAYVSYLGGKSVGIINEGQSRRLFTLTHGLAFVIGFSIVFIVLGITTSALSNLLFNMRDTLTRIGGIVVIVFGIHMIGIIRIPFLEYDTRRQGLPERRFGYFSSLLLGIFFSAGWSPCVGPVLGTILTLSMAGGSVFQGATLLTAYSLGLAVPFLFAALGIGWVSIIIQRYGKTMHYIEIFMGIILVIVGVMLFTGTFQTLSRYGFWVDFGL
jgi:cytochrome c-type biogenesis protein